MDKTISALLEFDSLSFYCFMKDKFLISKPATIIRDLSDTIFKPV